VLRVWPFQRCQKFSKVSALVYSLYGIRIVLAFENI
jgi:hypothetical protein